MDGIVNGKIAEKSQFTTISTIDLSHITDTFVNINTPDSNWWNYYIQINSTQNVIDMTKIVVIGYLKCFNNSSLYIQNDKNHSWNLVKFTLSNNNTTLRISVNYANINNYISTLDFLVANS